MKKKAALIVCGILAASFVTSAASDHLVMGEANAAERSGSRTTSRASQADSTADDGAEDSSSAGSSQAEEQETATSEAADAENEDARANAGNSGTSTGSAADTARTAAGRGTSTAGEASTDAGEENSAAVSASNEEDNEEETAPAGRTEQTEASESASTGSGEDSEEETEEDGETLADGRDVDGEETTDGAEDAADAESTGEASSDAGEDVDDTDDAQEETSISGNFSDYLTAAVPEDWEDQADMEEETVHGLPAVAYYEKTSHDSQEGGGLLVRIGLYADRDAYLSLPNYAFLGNLRTEDGQLYAVIAEFPSDVQFSTDAAEQYQQMEEEIPSLLKSLEATDGQTYHAGKTKADQAAEKTYAFASVLDQFRTSGMLPNGTMIDISTASANTNQYAILDVNGDGQDELVLKIGSKAASDKISRAAESAEAAATDEESVEEAATAENSTEDTADESSTDEDSTEESDAEETVEESGEDLASEADTASDEEDTADEDSTEESDADASLLFGGHHAAADTEASDSDNDVDIIAASNYYVFMGDSETDSHASHLTADDLAEALTNSSESYTETAYDINWEDISQGTVNRLYARAAAPVGESAEHIDALRRHAYKAAMQDIIENNNLPDGSEVVPYGDYTEEDIAENHFAVQDVDADGFDELLIQITNTDGDAARELVYGFDTDKKELVLEFEGVPDGTIYYDDGTLQAQAKYDNNEPSALWPFQLGAYDEETGSYDFKGSVYAWDADLMQRRQTSTVDALTQSFPTEADTNGNGRVYFLDLPDEDADSDAESDDTQNAESTDAESAVDDAAILSWYNSVVSANSEPIDIIWNTITEDYIRSELTNW